MKIPKTLKIQGLVVKNSSIHGRGLFASRAFQKGDLVVVWSTARVITSEQFRKLPESEKQYIAKMGKHFIKMPQPARFINHSHRPNIKPLRVRIDVATRDIRRGEEIVADYLSSKKANSRSVSALI